jgi:hypothetical protein
MNKDGTMVYSSGQMTFKSASCAYVVGLMSANNAGCGSKDLLQRLVLSCSRVAGVRVSVDNAVEVVQVSRLQCAIKTRTDDSPKQST